MMRSVFGGVAAIVLLALACEHSALDAGAGDKQTRKLTPQELTFFEKEVLPVLKANCFKCHGGEKVRANLRLTSRETILKGGDLGPAVSLEKPETSRLLQAINYQDDLQMPPNGKLPQKDIDILTRWVKAGIPFVETIVAGGKEQLKHEGGVVTEEARKYWAYQPVKRPLVPEVKNAGWVQNPIDTFILSKLEEKELTPAAPADRVGLIRRATYDLTGLPPRPEDVDAFVADQSPRAYENLIDRLLASPHYGEKWGRHWLDLVRYAETNGYERDGIKPFAWRFRDYVIRSFNQDKPYDRFIREQLAGDEIDRNDADCVIATGYYRLGLWDDEPVDPKQSRYDELDDIVATTSQVFLAMTMNCARCHDHKKDPIPQKDYYQMLAFFQDIEHFSKTRDVRSPFNLTDITPMEFRARYEAEQKRREERIAELEAAITRIEDEAIKKMPAEDQRAAEGLDRPQVLQRLPKFFTDEQSKEYRKLKNEATALKKQPHPGREFALSVNNCTVNPPLTHVLIRGNPHAPGAKVEPAFPTVLGFDEPTIPKPEPGARSSGRRSGLADWIASPGNPLTARVMANRIWQYHFGRGIVPTPNDFGKLGEAPTHPELLDWLASELVAGGWTMKRMHQLIMTSNTYRMSAQANDRALRIDPANTLYWRHNMRRLSAEEVRDSMLAVSGQLNPKMAGPSIYPPIPKEVLAGQSVPGQGWHTSGPEEAARRSVYVHIKRSLLVPILSHHDQADTDSSCPVRHTTTVPTQALGMLNGEFTNEQATAMAGRLRREAPAGLEAQVRRAIRLTSGREPSAHEVRKDLDFIRDLRSNANLGEEDALRYYCLMMLNTNEFIYLD